MSSIEKSNLELRDEIKKHVACDPLPFDNGKKPETHYHPSMDTDLIDPYYGFFWITLPKHNYGWSNDCRALVLFDTEEDISIMFHDDNNAKIMIVFELGSLEHMGFLADQDITLIYETVWELIADAITVQLSVRTYEQDTRKNHELDVAREEDAINEQA